MKLIVYNARITSIDWQHAHTKARDFLVCINALSFYYVRRNRVGGNDKTIVVTLKKAFYSNGASIPRSLRSLVSPLDIIDAGVVHDYLYKVDHHPLTKQVADQVFYLLCCQKLPKWKAWLCYQAVRLFGNKYYE